MANQFQSAALALKDDPLFAEFRRGTQQLSTVSLSPPLPPFDPKAIDAWKARAPELRRNWESQKAKLEAEHERLEKLLATKSAIFRESLEQRRVTPDGLVAVLKEQDRPTALVDVLEYHYYARKNKDEKNEWRFVAFVVRGDRPIARVELGSVDTISQQVVQWREGFGRKSNAQNPGEELRKSVWLPLEPHLEGIEIVLVSPDGTLAQLPWGALPGAKPGSYLLEQRAIAVIPVPQILPTLLKKERRAGRPQSLLLAGDIDYGGDPGGVFPIREGKAPAEPSLSTTGGSAGASPSDKREAIGRLRDGKLFEFTRLPAGPVEMAGIEKRYQPKPGSRAADMLRGSAATEAAFCEQARQHAWLHLITHGYFAPETVRSALAPDPDEEKSFRLLSNSDRPRVVKGEHPGLLSGLAFAGANTPPAPGHDDGILTALEVSSLDLSNVDAVVLSACETGLGEVAGGEGLLGLQRAFQVAGAKTVVASLWKVPDAETSLLMQLFYENVWEKKLPRLEALRQAQLQLLHNYDAQSHTLRGTVGKLKPPTDPAPTDPANKQAPRCPPFFWAAFVLSGDWR